MALLYLESFDNYSDAITGINLESSLLDRYTFADMTTNTNASITDGRHNGKAISMTDEAHFVRTRALRDAFTSGTGFVGFAVKTRDNNPLKEDELFFNVIAGNTFQLSFRLNSTGTVTAYRANSTFLETSPKAILAPRTGWFYMEVKFVIADSGGNWEWKIDGNTVWTSSNYDTRSDSDMFWDRIGFNGGDIATDTLLDDIYVADSSGSVNNDFLGPTVVELLQPDSDGSDSDWTPSSGTNHAALIDEAQNMSGSGLSETDYISSGTSGDLDLFNYTDVDILGGASAIHGVQVNSWRRITGEEPADLLIKSKTGTTEGQVTDTVNHDQSSPYYMQWSVFEIDPTTTTAWTPGGVDGAQFGVEVG